MQRAKKPEIKNCSPADVEAGFGNLFGFNAHMASDDGRVERRNEIKRAIDQLLKAKERIGVALFKNYKTNQSEYDQLDSSLSAIDEAIIAAQKQIEKIEWQHQEFPQTGSPNYVGRLIADRIAKIFDRLNADVTFGRSGENFNDPTGAFCRATQLTLICLKVECDWSVAAKYVFDDRKKTKAV
jgi:hypothetical protein